MLGRRQAELSEEEGNLVWMRYMRFVRRTESIPAFPQALHARPAVAPQRLAGLLHLLPIPMACVCWCSCVRSLAALEIQEGPQWQVCWFCLFIPLASI